MDFVMNSNDLLPNDEPLHPMPSLPLLSCAQQSIANKENSLFCANASSSQRHRFKVVKLVSSEPYLRGRWNCKDFISKDNDVIATANGGNQCVANTTTTQQPTPSQTAVTTGSAIDNNKAVTAAAAEQPPNGVAIDNKIEQAMDLVKSHLMFAVREEVDVLKERIKELESEIQILRAHSTPEVLNLILQSQQQSLSSNNSSQTGNQSQNANPMNE